MRPSSGQLIELAWCRARTVDSEPQVESCLIALEEAASLPRKISELTGITEKELRSTGLSFGEALEKLEAGGLQTPSLIHYAQFERPFLEDLFSRQNKTLSFEIFCTNQIAKMALPSLPSRNIRALAGYFGLRLGEVKRAEAHVRATFEIWKGLVEELNRIGVTSVSDLKVWLTQPAEKATRYEYRIEKTTRFSLPDRPGVYRMIAKNGEILYVGKATSLKSRVNSYFRGRKGRDPKKLEMLAQVWNIEVTECDSPLEAALLENDEIKRIDPPYNVSLKAGPRRMLFYSRDLSLTSEPDRHSSPASPRRRIGTHATAAESDRKRLEVPIRCAFTGNSRLSRARKPLLDLFSEGQRDRNRPAVLRDDFRAVQKASRARQVSGHRHRTRALQKNCRKSWRPNLGGFEAGRGFDFLFYSSGRLIEDASGKGGNYERVFETSGSDSLGGR
jgi:DNA polymerase III epsilon subunit-like protein